MSFLNKLRDRFCISEGEHLNVLEQGIGLLRLSTYYTLRRKYNQEYDLDTASSFAVAVLSVMILESSNEPAFMSFYQKHRKRIGEMALDARNDKDISGMSGCASYLYAAEILHANMVKASHVTDATKTWKSVKELEAQAATLGIVIPSSREICDSDDRFECIDAIHRFAKAFYYTNTWMGKSPALTEMSLPSIPYNYEFLATTLLQPTVATPERELQQENEREDVDVSTLCRLTVNS